MTPERFDEQVRKRANETVQQNIQNCKRGIAVAICQLLGVGAPNLDRGNIRHTLKRKEVQAVLSILVSEKPDTGWPAELWVRERARLSDEILSRMDELQKMMIAKDSRADEVEAAPEEENDDA